ncbi:MAG: hypothetical protein A2073_04000 [Deltaproteobacteria bacterium GWC2_42_11]|nr:MAG: hypothetical protein A2073_04000 [Deltaproteobacteria bacterium GWC2_42_11]
MERKPFQNIHIVLVEPQGAGNIGSAARAMKNTGFKNLALVNPVDYKNDEAYKMACKADDVLLGAKVFTSLENATKDASMVIGTTRRKGRIRYPVLTFYDVLPRIIETAQKNNVFILFGREDKGLSNKEIELCSDVVEIPADKSYPSLNLSHAVFLVCYELFKHTAEEKGQAIKLASMEEINMMYEHLEKTLRKLGYGEKGGMHLLDVIMKSFRRLFGRTGLMHKEVNMVRGICTQIEKRVG